MSDPNDELKIEDAEIDLQLDMAAHAERTPFRALLARAGEHRRRVIIAIVVTVLNKAFDVMPEILIGVAIDVVVRGQDSFVADWFGVDSRWSQLLIVAGINVVIWVCESITDYGASLAWRNLAQEMQHSVRTELYAHLQTLDLAWFDDRSSGGLLAILNDDINQLERFLDVGAKDIILTLTNVLFVGVFFVAVSWELAVLAFLPIPIIVAGSLWWQTRLAHRYLRVREAVEALSATLINNLSGMATITAFTAEAREERRVEALSSEYREANRDAIKVSSAFVPLIRMAILSGFTATLLFGGRQTINGVINVGLFTSLVYSTQRLLWPLTRLGETFDQYQRAAASTRRILALEKVEPTITPGPVTFSRRPAGAIELRDVHFAYGAGPAVIDGITLRIAPGETHAIVGTTGAGKSTLLRLLLRHYQPTAGQITLDGVPLDELTFESLRGSYGYVDQDAFLFEGTVKDNLAYGDPDADDAALRRALELSEAAEFVDRLVDGWDTKVGERGHKLSGGQRQRLALARAIVRDPVVLVLDEATSAVDNETEAAIQRSLGVVSADRTTVVVAHRLSTVRNATAIHVLDRGRVAESGTHEDLLEMGGLYAALWRVQTGTAIEGIDA